MSTPPSSPKIYHITHVDNLPSILATGGLTADAAMIAHGGPQQAIGMSTIKQRRLSLPVPCHPGDHVGDYVPFYFCTRSVMLYVIYRGNHQELTYRDGQPPIVHLEADLHAVVEWAATQGRRWAFTPANAGAVYTNFYADLAALDMLDWVAIGASDFRQPEVKEGKQAEFLLHGGLPWELVERIGVCTAAVRGQVDAALVAAGHRPGHRPVVELKPNWYY